MNELQICSQFLTQKLTDILDIPVFNGIQEEQDNLNTYCVFFINEIKPVKYVSNIQAFSNCDVYIDIWSQNGYSYELAEKLNSLLDGQQGEVIGESESIGYVNSCIFQAQHSMTPYDNEGWYGVQAQYTVRVQGISEKPEPDIRYYQEDIENAIIKKRNLQGADLTTIPPNKMASEIDKIRLGVPVVQIMTENTDADGNWIRPEAFPDLDSLLDWKQNDFEGVYMTYDNTSEATARWANWYIAGNSVVNLERGHILNGEFIVDESVEYQANRNNPIDYSSLTDDYVVYRITPVSGKHFNIFQFSRYPGRSGSNWEQNCVEVVGKLNYITSMESVTGNSGGSMATNYTQNFNVDIGRYSVITNMSWAFRYCYNLVNINTNWKTDNWNPNYLTFLFGDCSSLTKIDFSSWNTTNWQVERFDSVFVNCVSLKEIDFSPLKTTNWRVDRIGSMFLNCYSLEELDLSCWDTSNWQVTLMTSMFQTCRSLQKVNVNWNTSNWSPTSMYYMFTNCYSLQEIDLSFWDTSNWELNTIQSLFDSCFSLQRIDTTGWDTTKFKLATLTRAFYGCYSLQELDLSHWELDNTGLSGNFNALFNTNNSLRYCNITPLNYTTTTNDTVPSGRELREYYPVPLRASQNYSSCYRMTKASLLRILNTLPTLTGSESYTLTLGTLIGKLSLEEIEIATNKGWTVA